MNSLTLVKELAILLARGSIISMLAVSILLPAALLLLDPIFSVTSLKWPSRNKPTA
jgi:predicted RND superfamily exporter protein